MHYIHTSSIKLHGRLSSACCFIDSRFTLKVADVGLPSFFNMNLAEYWSQKRRPDFYYRQFWVAPEVLREQENRVEEVVKVTTKEQDIYSFGIIMQEIILHSPPYAMYGDDYTDERKRLQSSLGHCSLDGSAGKGLLSGRHLQCYREGGSTRYESFPPHAG